jgi:hypothetical protein
LALPFSLVPILMFFLPATHRLTRKKKRRLEALQEEEQEHQRGEDDEGVVKARPPSKQKKGEMADDVYLLLFLQPHEKHVFLYLTYLSMYIVMNNTKDDSDLAINERFQKKHSGKVFNCLSAYNRILFFICPFSFYSLRLCPSITDVVLFFCCAF